MPSPDLPPLLPTGLSSSSGSEDRSSRLMGSPSYPPQGIAFPPRSMPMSFASKSMESSSLAQKVHEAGFMSKGLESQSSFPSRNMDMPYGHRLLQDHGHIQ